MTAKTKPIYAPFIRRADRVAKKREQTRTTLSAALFNDGKKLDRLADGGEAYHSVYIDAEAKLAAMERDLGLVN